MQGSGWIGLYPTLGKPLRLQHVRGVYRGRAGQRLSVDVRVRPALDDDGREQLNGNKAASADLPVIGERAQLPAQQQ